MSGYKNASIYLSYGFPVNYIKSNLFVAVNTAYRQIPGYLNDTRQFTKRTTGGVSVTLNSNISKEISFKINSNVNVAHTQYDQTAQDNTILFTRRTSADLEWNFGQGLVFQTDLNYINYNRVSGTFDNSSLLWNVSFGKKLFKGQRGYLRLYVHDLLRENNNISQRYTETYIEEQKALDLDRYITLLFTYNIKPFAGKTN